MEVGSKFKILDNGYDVPLGTTIGKTYVVDALSPFSGYVEYIDDLGNYATAPLRCVEVIEEKPQKTSTHMTTEEYFEFIKGINDKMLDLVKKKNADYTGGEGPFANFKIAEKYGVDPIVGLSVRMGDKMQRLQSYCKKGKLEVDGEGLADIAYDFIGYSWLLLGLMRERELNGK